MNEVSHDAGRETIIMHYNIKVYTGLEIIFFYCTSWRTQNHKASKLCAKITFTIPSPCILRNVLFLFLLVVM